MVYAWLVGELWLVSCRIMVG